jgi:tetratricopeptide (TPR) repeat protein
LNCSGHDFRTRIGPLSREVSLTMKRIAYWALPLLLIGALTTQGLAQAQQAQAEPDPKWNSNAEFEAYMVCFKEADHAKKAACGEKFAVDYKNADPIVMTHIYKFMLLGFANAGNWAKTIETIERQAMAPKLTADEKKQYNQIGLVAAANAKNNPKTIEYAEKVLKDDPKNFQALVTLSGVLSSTLPQTDPAKGQQITRTLEVTRQALALPNPGLAAAQWNQVQLQLRETTCLMLLNQQKYTESIAECQEALKLNPKDGFAWYWIGLSHRAALIDLAKKYNDAVKDYNDNRSAGPLVVDEKRAIMQGADKVASDKKAEAEDAFAKAAALGGEAGKQAMAELQKLFEGTPADLEKFIQEKKSQFGN